MKTCNKCERKLSVRCFTNDSGKQDGKRTVCKDCTRESQKLRYLAHRHEACQKQKEYREANKDKVSQGQKRYAQKHRKKIAAYQKEWREVHREEMRTYSRAYYKKNKGRWKKPEDCRKRYRKTGRALHLRKKFGITQADYDALLESQGRGCAICGTKNPGKGKRYFHVDHCHETGAIRGLLCVKCNMGLGCFNDDDERLYAALNYLKRPAFKGKQ